MPVRHDFPRWQLFSARWRNFPSSDRFRLRLTGNSPSGRCLNVALASRVPRSSRSTPPSRRVENHAAPGKSAIPSRVKPSPNHTTSPVGSYGIGWICFAAGIILLVIAIAMAMSEQPEVPDDSTASAVHVEPSIPRSVSPISTQVAALPATLPVDQVRPVTLLNQTADASVKSPPTVQALPQQTPAGITATNAPAPSFDAVTNPSDANAGIEGTAVNFLCNPQQAARLAAQEQKLCLVLHLSGNFEDPRFT